MEREIVEQKYLREFYAKGFDIALSQKEFCLDFQLVIPLGKVFPEEGEPIHIERHQPIVVIPVIGKLMMKALENSIGEFERKYGAIDEKDELGDD